MAVKSADRTVQLLEAFAAAGEALGVAELARRLAIPVSACHGLLKSLEDRGYLYELGPRKGWYPTLRWLQQARLVAARDPLLKRMAARLEELCAATGETVVLAKRAGSSITYLSVSESQNPIRYSAQVGDRKPLHSSAAGKALLGALAPEARATLLDGLKLARVTPNTIVKREALEKDLAAGATRGWFMTRGENVADVYAIATPLRLDREDYALVLAGPGPRLEANLKTNASALLRAKKDLEALR